MGTENEIDAAAAAELASIKEQARRLKERKDELDIYFRVRARLAAVPAEKPAVTNTHQPTARSNSTKAQVIALAHELIAEHGRITTKDLLDTATERGIQVGSKIPSLAVSKTLGASGDFKNKSRKEGWFLAEKP